MSRRYYRMIEVEAVDPYAVTFKVDKSDREGWHNCPICLGPTYVGGRHQVFVVEVDAPPLCDDDCNDCAGIHAPDLVTAAAALNEVEQQAEPW